LNKAPRFDSLGSFTSTDEDILASLFALEDNEKDSHKVILDNSDGNMSPESALSMGMGAGAVLNPESRMSTNSTSSVDPALMHKIQQSLTCLPPHLQRLFVERLVAVTTNPELFQRQVEAVTALATSAVTEAKRRVETNFPDANRTEEKTNEQAVHLATSVLAAFLNRYRPAEASQGQPSQQQP